YCTMNRFSTLPSLCRRCRRKPKRGSVVSHAISSFLAPRSSAAMVFASNFIRMDFLFRKRQGSGSSPSHDIWWHRYKGQIAPEIPENKGACASWQPLSTALVFAPESGHGGRPATSSSKQRARARKHCHSGPGRAIKTSVLIPRIAFEPFYRPRRLI